MSNLQQEIELWKPVPNYELTYEVSNLGRFRIINYRNTGRSKLMKLSFDSDGYPILGFVKNKKQLVHKAHRVVATVFIPNPLSLPQVNHIKGIKTDIRASQLEWCTCQQNIQHSFDIGLKVMPKGDNTSWAKVTERDVIDIRTAVKNGAIQRRLAEKYNVTFQTISSIVRNKNWKHVQSAA